MQGRCQQHAACAPVLARAARAGGPLRARAARQPAPRGALAVSRARAPRVTQAHLLPSARVRSPILVVPLCCAPFACGDAVAQDTVREFREAHGEFGARATSWAPVSLLGTWLPEGTIHKEPGEFDLTQVTLDAVVPIPQSRDTFFTAGILAAARHYDFDGVPVSTRTSTAR
jgi:hypothetical protein